MAAVTSKLTFAQFQEQFGGSDRAYEFWYGEAIPKAMPTVVHGLLQRIVMELLHEAGYIAASEVDLHIDPQAHPRPDVIASRSMPVAEPYPTKGWDVAVEILSEDDSYAYLKEKARKFREWGFGQIFAVDPSDRSVAEWKDGQFTVVTMFAGFDVDRIWQELDRVYPRSW
jgi:Uma2 family endonuclease